MSIPSRIAVRGLTLVELIVSIVIIGVGVAGIVLVFNTTVRASVDPLLQKQALAVAEALLEEVQLMPYTYCDPDDTNAETALGADDCSGGSGGPNNESRDPLGAESGETRTGAVTPFDNVSDYHGFGLSGITDIVGNAIQGLEGYSAQITVTKQGVAAVGAVAEIPDSEALLITVTVTGPGDTSVRLDGYRTRYAPNLLP
ncbi:MAG: prepilin-type N-terminal cleavage/methylation domain-containing protein [Burkholderiales bacterium]